MVEENTGEQPQEAERDPSIKGGLPYYCPACGQASKYPGYCTGDENRVGGNQGHKRVELVSTDELHGDPSGFTPSPI